MTFLAATIFGAYLGFANLNNATIQEPYKTAFQKIGGEYTNFETIGTTASDKGLVTNILNFGGSLITGTVNVFVVGLKAMGSFLGMGTYIQNIFSALGLVFNMSPALIGLFNLAILIIVVYLAMRYIQSVSNKFELP